MCERSIAALLLAIILAEMCISAPAPLPPESDLLQHVTAVPDPASTDYLLVTQSQNSTQEMFNGIQRTTWNVEISGKNVIFDNTTANYGGLFTRFHNRADMKNMSIYAETLIIRSPLRLPGTNVTVYARYLRFEDAAGQGSLDMTPLAFATGAAQYQNGLAAQKGGDIALHIQNFYSQPGPTVRLIARGGAGQDAGQGRSGNPKPDLIPAAPNAGNWGPGPWNMRWGAGVGRVVLDWSFKRQTWGWVIGTNGQPFPQSATYPSIVSVQCDPCGQYRGGQQPVWPQDGENAVPPGVPGVGGAGGAISSSIQSVSTLLEVGGGLSGQPGAAQNGGPPQRPIYSAWLKTIDGSRCNDDYFNFQMIAIHTAVAGTNAPSIPAAAPHGSNGSFVLLGDPSSLSWLHPYLLRAVIAHARDAYRTGNLTYTQDILQDYSKFLSQFSIFPADFALDFQQAQNEMQGLLFQLANNKDYFGNPAGWVPLLSLEATMSAFNSEVDAAVPILFLSQWLESKANQNQKDVTALQDAMTKLSDEAASAASNVNTAQRSLPMLQYQAAQINSALQNVQVALQQKEAALLEQAKKNVEDQRKVPFWKQALRVIGTVAETVPAFQPALGAIGAGLNFVTNFDVSQPLQSLQNAQDITTLFKGKTWTDSETSFNNFLKSVDFRSFGNAQSFAQQLGSAYKDHQTLIQQTMQQLQTTQIADSDIQKEFDQLKAQDSIFNDLIQQVSDLETHKQVFVQSVSNTLQEIGSGQATINKDLLSVASMYQNLNSTAAQFDHSMVAYLVDMDRRARERLLRYQYYMAKAYEYRMLQPYQGNLNIDSVVNKILAVMGTDGYAGLGTSADLAAIKAVYLDSVRQIISSALTQLQSQPPERSLPFYFKLTAPQLLQLNQVGQVTLDLAPLIAGLPNEDNRHIADLSVANITVQNNGALGPVARVRIVVDHQGQSTETLNGHTYKFYFGNGPDEQPFTWGASYNLPNGPLSQEALSVSGLSLLQSLLNISGPLDPLMLPLTLFARPGADAVVTLTKVQDPPNLNAQITNLQMSATVDFFRISSNLVRLSVQTANNSLPHITLDRADITGRSDGQGTFQRTFNVGDRVTLSTEAAYGTLTFLRWTDDTGNVLGRSPILTLTLSTSMSVHPVYTISSSATPGLSISKVHGGIFTQGQAGATYTVVVSNSLSAGPTSGPVTVTDTLPSGLALVSVSGTGWNCASNTCVRNDSLAAGAHFPPITVTVNVSPNAGSPQVNQVSVSAAGSATATATDSTTITTSSKLPSLTLSRGTVNFGVSGSTISSPQAVSVSFTGGPGADWTASASQPNIFVSPARGTSSGVFQITVIPGPSGLITVTAPGASNSPQQVHVNVTSVTPSNPYGSFDTPINNTSGIAGAIPVTGWCLDGVECQAVKIWREPVVNESPQSNGLVYIGDAVFVDGARPDVESAYPNAPMNYRAGWGYLLLTNFLPNNGGSPGNGNGVYKLHAIAQSKSGNQFDLGTRTIVVDNAHASKPFGTIDTPSQGGTVSGSAFVNFGWALTQNPNCIATDGSTLTVNVDGVDLGHAAYNQMRNDIATLFPGLCNSNGAVGFFYIDTTKLANGVHTISWVAYDNVGHGEGLGSRYFNVQNPGATNVPVLEAPLQTLDIGPIAASRTHGSRSFAEALRPDQSGVFETEELERIEIDGSVIGGYSPVNGEHRTLPIGSTVKGGVFHWQLGPGFLGEYDLMLIRSNGEEASVRVRVRPKVFGTDAEKPLLSDKQIMQ